MYKHNMAARGPTPPPSPAKGETPQNCRRCELWERATQAVPGEGSSQARILLVGEQPGDAEDRDGHPFVGPAGRLLDELLSQAQIPRAQVFITNAVKHFNWEPRGKRRLHKRPELRHIEACSVWLTTEISALRPRVIVALGATALRAVTGASLPIAQLRGKPLAHSTGARIVATYHPSAILRANEEGALQLRRAMLVDLRRARKLAASDDQ
ncbi:MAG: UdgX family uracil-DNA binding protein [Terriglobales bacterium]